jgi:hypothetical protein
MHTDQNDNTGSLRASQEPHQREEMDQAESASKASFTLEPEKGLSPDPEEFNQGDAQDNIKQIDQDDKRQSVPAGTASFDTVSPVNLDEDENTVTPDDLQALTGLDQDEENTM